MSNECASENSQERGIYSDYGDNWWSSWSKKDARGEVNGIGCVQRCNPVSTRIDIRVGESDSTERLERFFSRFLSHCAESSTLIADVRGYADRDEFPLSIIEHPLERRRQIIGELPVAAAQSLRLNWFDAHYALFCVGGRISTSYEYAMKARRMLPDAALNRRLISAYVAGEEIEGYTLGIMGAHPEILPQLMKALSE